MRTLEQIEAKIVSLPRKLQLQVVERLNARLWPTGFDPRVEEAWSDTVKRRLEALERGKVEGVSSAKVFARSRRLLAKK